MRDTSMESWGGSGSPLRNSGIIGVLLLLCIILWGAYVIVPAGSRGVVLWGGRVEQRIMKEGLHCKVPRTDSGIKVDVRGQPPPFRESDASSKEYQIVKMTGMRNFHIAPAFVNDLYQKVGLDFADKVIDPAFNVERGLAAGFRRRDTVHRVGANVRSARDRQRRQKVTTPESTRQLHH